MGVSGGLGNPPELLQNLQGGLGMARGGGSSPRLALPSPFGTRSAQLALDDLEKKE